MNEPRRRRGATGSNGTVRPAVSDHPGAGHATGQAPATVRPSLGPIGPATARLAAFAPSGARGWQGMTVALASAACLFAILVAELFIPLSSSLGALTVLPVAASAWLLPGRQAAPVVALALLVRIAGVFDGLDAITAGAEMVLLLLSAVAIRSAAELLIRWRESEAELREQAAELAVMVERERIGSELISKEVRILFAASLKLQGAVTMAMSAHARERVQGTIDDLDQLVADLRQEVFKRPAEAGSGLAAPVETGAERVTLSSGLGAAKDGARPPN